MSPLLALSGHRATSESCPLSGVKRTSMLGAFTSAFDLGCVKTPKSNLRIEISSRLRQFKEQQRWRPLLGVDNRENYSARSSCAHVFTQPRPKADIGGQSQCDAKSGRAQQCARV